MTSIMPEDVNSNHDETLRSKSRVLVVSTMVRCSFLKLRYDDNKIMTASSKIASSFKTEHKISTRGCIYFNKYVTF